MKKVSKCLIIVVILLATFSLPVFGAEVEEEYWQDYVDIVPEEKKPGDIEDVLSGVGIEALLSEILAALGEGSSAVLSFFAMLIGISALLAVAECAAPFDTGGLSKHAAAAVSIIASVLIFGKIGGICFSVRDSLSELTAFFSGLVPILTGILTAGGNLNSAATQAMNMNVTLGAVSYITTTLLIPLVFSLFALALASGIDGGSVSAVAKSIKGVFMWVLGIGTAVIIGAVSMQSIIAGAQDSAYLRAAKYAASGMIPVVGATVSSSLATLAGGLSYLKSAVGVSSVMLIVTLTLSPLIMLLLYRLAFSLAISFLEFVGASGGARCFGAFRSAFDALISVYALSAVVYVSEIVVFMRSGVNVFG